MSKNWAEGANVTDLWEELRTLRGEHQALEVRLEGLQERPWLSVAEETERNRIKKQKLLLKDRMVALERQLQS